MERLRELAVVSPRAAVELDAVKVKADILKQRIHEDRSALEEEVKATRDVVPASPPAAEVDALRVGVEQRQRAPRLADARRAGVREHFGKLERTAHRGIHRLGNEWVVLEPGDYGVDKRHLFQTSDEATACRERLRAEDLMAAREACAARDAAVAHQRWAKVQAAHLRVWATLTAAAARWMTTKVR